MILKIFTRNNCVAKLEKSTRNQLVSRSFLCKPIIDWNNLKRELKNMNMYNNFVYQLKCAIIDRL